jgi:hypothetical protein
LITASTALKRRLEDEEEDVEEEEDVGTAALGCPSGRSPEVSPRAPPLAANEIPTIKTAANEVRSGNRPAPIDFDCEVMIL